MALHLSRTITESFSLITYFPVESLRRIPEARLVKSTLALLVQKSYPAGIS